MRVEWLDLSLLRGLLVLCSAPGSVGKKRTVVVTDQGAVPKRFFSNRHHIPIMHAYSLTESLQTS